jgi:hypothetical protein
MFHLSVSVQDTGFQPFPDQMQKRLVINALFEHPNHPIVVNVVEEPLDVRLHYPAVPPVLQLIGQTLNRIVRTATWTIPIAASKEILLVNGLQDFCYCQLQQLILGCRYS